jgi:PIN domain nuclease of toxin-antitoxin system
MNLPIDTHVLIWWSTTSRRLGQQAKELISSPRHSVWVSSVSIWEISIKASLGRLELGESLGARIAADLEHHGFHALPIGSRTPSRCGIYPSIIAIPSTACRSRRPGAKI